MTIGTLVIGILGAYVLVAVFVTRTSASIVKRWFGSSGATVATVISGAIFVLIPTWDELLGTYQFRQLCRKETGVKIYGKMELPREFYSATGEPLFLYPNGDIDGFFGKRDRDDKTDLYQYVEFAGRGDRVPAFAHIERSNYCVANRKTGEKLACSAHYSYHGGWWRRRFGYVSWFPQRGCGEFYTYEIYRKIFFPVVEKPINDKLP